MKRKFWNIMLSLAIAVMMVSTLPFTANAATQEQAVNWAYSQIGIAVDVDGVYASQCSDFVTAYINWVNTGNMYSSSRTLNGYQYYNNCPSGWTQIPAGSKPQPGDVACWDKGRTSGDTVGHVGVVYSANSAYDFLIIDQNGTSSRSDWVQGMSTASNIWRPVRSEWEKVRGPRTPSTYNKLQGFLRPKYDNPAPPTISLSATPSPAGPKITVTTDGTGMYYVLYKDGKIITQEPVALTTNTWDFANPGWNLAAGDYEFHVQANRNYTIGSETKIYSFTILGSPSKKELTLTGTPSFAVISANSSSNDSLAALTNAVQTANKTLSASYSGGTSTLDASWVLQSGQTFNRKGGTYTFVGTLTPTDSNQFTYSGPNITLTVKVNPVNGTYIYAPASLTITKANIDTASAMSDLGLPSYVYVTYDNAVAGISYSITGWNFTLAQLKAVDVSAGNVQRDMIPTVVFPEWATINTGQLKTVITVETPIMVKPVVISATPSAKVINLKGNNNDLTITVVEQLSDGNINIITETIRINNNASGIYGVGSYKVYVDTKGNTQVRECRIAD